MPPDAPSARRLPISPLALASLLVSCLSAAVAVYAWSSLVDGHREQGPSILPDVLLVTSLVAAATIGALVWTSGVAARRARDMAAANAALAEIVAHAKPDTASGLESTLLERTEELREAVLDLEAFNVSVSHDLRSPIGAILRLGAGVIAGGGLRQRARR